MSKYIYYNGKIIEIIEHKAVVVIILGTMCITSYPKREFNHIYSNAKIVDNFEDLIEVGDLVHYGTSDHIEQVTELYDNKMATSNCRGRCIDDKNINEIWKRINNKFVRIAHKENDEWVID